MWPDRPPLRFLIQQALRRDDLCKWPQACPNELANPQRRCANCPITKLETEMLSYRGQLATRCMELAQAHEAGLTYTLDDLTAEELPGVMIARSELQIFRGSHHQ